ncbi:MAG: hypothetical protein J5781_07550 [Clostridia bacterium]|nr:hypothetical protein [Clostridia bacterium]
MAELFLSNARFFGRGSVEIGTSARLSNLKYDTQMSKKHKSFFWGFLLSIITLFSVFFTRSDANAGVNMISTVDFYFLYQQFVGFLATGLKIVLDSFFTLFSDVFFLLISFLALIFLAVAVTKKLKKERKEENRFQTQKHILERKRRVFIVRRFFITFSRFLS